MRHHLLEENEACVTDRSGASSKIQLDFALVIVTSQRKSLANEIKKETLEIPSYSGCWQSWELLGEWQNILLQASYLHHKTAQHKETGMFV